MGTNNILDWKDLDDLDICSVLHDRVAQVPKWFHRMRLPGGVMTPGVYSPEEKLHRIALANRLDGLSVLDVGAWDGFYSFECERRGASSVTSMDIWEPSHNATSEGYAVAHCAYKSLAKPIRGSVHDLDVNIHGMHDLVLFLGVFYHLKNPLEALFSLRKVTRGTLVLETASDFAFTRKPVLAFYENDELGKDDSNWFAPNASALIGMCKAAGFRKVELVYSMGLPTRLARAISRRHRFGESWIQGIAKGRIVVHAHT